MSSYPSHLIDAWKSLNILIVGDAMLDCYLMGNAERLCQEAPVPVVEIAQRQDYPGGAANVAANIASLGAKASLLSVVGNDAEGDRLRSTLAERDITTKHILFHPSRNTLAKQRVMAGPHLLVRFDQGSTEALPPTVEEELIRRLTALYATCDGVIVSDYAYGVLTPRLIKTLAHLQQNCPRLLLVDSKQLRFYAKTGVTAVKPNYKETLQLLGLSQQTERRVEQISPYGRRLLNLTGAAIVAVTLDSDGALLFERDSPPLHIPATPAPASHTSGAGDTFISALALGLTTQASLPVAASLAAAATAIVVSQPGTSICSAAALVQLLTNSIRPLPFNPLPAYA
jgi:D-beta-D-heptose 7-phosphate kinase/D-beta-D-heptose 1-phosphate adenosyltransferase